MKLDFNREQMLQLMKDFYLLSGIRIVLFNDEYQELLSYPQGHCAFCARIRQDPRIRRQCALSDEQAFRRSGEARKLVLYRCHAGLTEAVIPLMDNHIIIGYLMFGQISDLPDRNALQRQLSGQLDRYDIPADFDLPEGIRQMTGEQIRAAAKIMEACTLYATLNHTISLRREHFSNTLRLYLMEHLSEPLNAQDIAQGLGISRSKLYQQCQQYLQTGIAGYLQSLRLEKARQLLRNTALPVTRIASMVGFADYNYFCRVFRKETGLSPRQFRSGDTAQ